MSYGVTECEKKLETEFPYLYRKVVCGIELPPGWYDLVRELSAKLEPLVKEYNDSLADKENEMFVDQVKSKFGGLRYYVSTYGTKEICDLITKAEGDSLYTCEACGKPATQNTRNGWIWTLCDDHK